MFVVVVSGPLILKCEFGHCSLLCCFLARAWFFSYYGDFVLHNILYNKFDFYLNQPESTSGLFFFFFLATKYVN